MTKLFLPDRAIIQPDAEQSLGEAAIQVWRAENAQEACNVSIVVSFEPLEHDGTKMHVSLIDANGKTIHGWNRPTLAHYLRTAATQVENSQLPNDATPAHRPVTDGAKTPGRNKPCNCGSGRKAKFCCYPD